MMCVDYSKLTETLRIFEASGEVGYLHIDIMDGEFVPNYTLGTDFCRQLRMMTSIPLDIHLMVNNPERKLAWFEPHPKEIISVHYESTKAMKKLLK